jgi:hypothetical protein
MIKLSKQFCVFKVIFATKLPGLVLTLYFIRVTIFPLALPYNTVLAEVTIYPGGGGRAGGVGLKPKFSTH